MRNKSPIHIIQSLWWLETTNELYYILFVNSLCCHTLKYFTFIVNRLSMVQAVYC